MSGSALLKRVGIALLIEVVAVPLAVLAVILLYAAGLPGMEILHGVLLLFLLCSLVLFVRARWSAKRAGVDRNG